MHACLAGVVLSQFYLLQGFLVQYHLIHTYYDEADDIYYIYGFASLWLYFFLYINHLVHACLAVHTDVIFFLSDHACEWSYMLYWLLWSLSSFTFAERDKRIERHLFHVCGDRVAEIDGPAGHSTHKPVVVHTHTTHCNTGRQAYRGRNGRHIALHCMLILAGIYMHVHVLEFQFPS